MYLEDYTVGRVFTLDPVSATQDEIIAFATQFDPQPFHVDPDLPDNPFGGVIASGWHTCSLIMRSLVDGYFSPESSLASPGVDQLRWLAPLRPGDRLTVTAEVLENRRSSSKPDRGIIRTKVTATNQDGVEVLELVALNMLRARPGS